jgi:hypothetical protein
MRNTYTKFMLAAVAITALLLSSCGGGGGGGTNLPAPNPNPGAQQPPAQTSVPVASNILIGVSLGTTDLRMFCDPGSFESNATVQIIDGVGTVVQVTATQDGALDLFDADFPPTFDRTVGNPVMITQTAPGKTESPAINLVLQDIMFVGL